MTECVECGETEGIDRHHTSYDPEETVPLCRSCHQTVHSDESHELYPNDRPETTVIELTESQKDELDNLKEHPRESYKEVVGRLLDGAPESTEVDLDALKNELSMASDPTVEVDTDRIIGRIEDLESRLPTKVAEELQR